MQRGFHTDMYSIEHIITVFRSQLHYIDRRLYPSVGTLRKKPVPTPPLVEVLYGGHYTAAPTTPEYYIVTRRDVGGLRYCRNGSNVNGSVPKRTEANRVQLVR